MKKFLFTGIALLMMAEVFSQSPPTTPFDVGSTFSNYLLIAAPYEIAAPYLGVGPVTIYNTAQVDFVAGQRIHLQPGFHAGNFSGNGYFHAQIGTVPDFDVVFMEPNVQYPQVGLNNKLELGVHLPVSLSTQVQNFLSSGSGINPFDETQIRVQATFTNSSQSFSIDGFYYEDFVRDPNALSPLSQYNWIPQPTHFNWRIRFAPPFLGNWNVDIKVLTGSSSQPLYQVQGIQFACVPSGNPGHLRIGSDNRHLKFSSTNESFFAIGQNIAWPDKPYFRGEEFLSQPLLWDGGILDIYDWINSVADNNGNFVRFLVTPEFGEVEWGQLGNYSSMQEPGVTGLMQAWELDHLFELCENRQVYLMLNLVFHGEYVAVTEDRYGWDDNPYNRDISGIDVPTDLYMNAAAHAKVMKNLKNKYRYYMSRWGYSTSLGVVQIFSEFDNWDGHENMDDAGYDQLREDAFDFLEELLLDIRSRDVGQNHLLGVSFGDLPTKMGNANDHIFASPLVDVTSFNHYSNERTATRAYFKIYDDMFDSWDKPALVTELGLTNGPDTTLPSGTEVSQGDANDITSCSAISFHNLAWGTAFSGSYGTGLQWWQWFNDDLRLQVFPALQTFFSGVDFETHSYENPGRWDDGLFSWSDNSHLETVYLKSENNNHAIGWVHNLTYWWGNVDQNCPDRNGLSLPVDTNNGPLDPGYYDDIWQSPQPAPQGQFFLPRIEGLSFGRYSIQMYLTKGGGGPFLSPQSGWTDLFGRLQLPNPNIVLSYEQDYAFKADYDPLFSMRTTESIELDTVYYCGRDTIRLTNEIFHAQSQNLTCKWYVNNTFYDSTFDVEFIFNPMSLYSVKLELFDSVENVLVISQTFCGIECDITSYKSGIPVSSSNETSIILFPNPIDDNLNIALASDSELIEHVKIYSCTGELMLIKYGSGSNTMLLEFPVPAGLYQAVITSNRKRYSKTILKI